MIIKMKMLMKIKMNMLMSMIMEKMKKFFQLDGVIFSNLVI